jgi:hypothetical protein
VELTVDEWKSVLKLATAWEFLSVRDTAVQQLSKTPEPDLIEKLIMAVRFHVDSWILDTLNQIAKRDGPLSTADAERLIPVVGLDYVMKITQVREDGTSNATPAHNYSCASCGRSYPCTTASTTTQTRSQRDYTSIIRVVFGLQA